jgi:alpha-tubulin suppressor-like RCC1 family protein
MQTRVRHSGVSLLVVVLGAIFIFASAWAGSMARTAWAASVDLCPTCSSTTIQTARRVPGGPPLTRVNGQEAMSLAFSPQSVVAVVAGASHTCALTGSGGVKCWGSNNNGQLGDGTTVGRTTPVDVNGLTSGVLAIAAGAGHTCALTSAGGVKCWGSNLSGQLGDGTTTQNGTPVDVNGLVSGVAAIAAGYHHTCALTDAGIVKCWGGNSSGQLGDGTTTQHSTPADVGGLPLVIRLAAGNIHTCAVTASGGVKCWGWNMFGQLGDGTTTQRTAPVDVVGLTSGIAEISTGDIHTCVLTDSGAVKCWGDNTSGQLGDGTTTRRTAPVEVSELTSGITGIAASTLSYHTCAVTAIGGAKCWGSNRSGQLGDGTTTNRTSPVDVSGLTRDAITITSGREHTCAVMNSSQRVIKCWGGNGGGQLGDGTTVGHGTPTNLVGWSAVGEIPPSGGQLGAFGADVDFANTFTDTVIVTHTIRPGNTIGSPDGLYGVGYFYELTAVYKSTGQPASPAPGQLYTVTIRYSDADKGAAVENTLRLYYVSGQQWITETTSIVNTMSNTVMATPNHFSTWAVLGETNRRFLPLVVK